MDFVIIWGRNNDAERAVERGRQLDVGMLAQCLNRRQYAIKREGFGAGSGGTGEQTQKSKADKALTRMLAQGGSDVDRRIGVMHTMKAPQGRDFMHRHVRGVGLKVENNDEQAKLDPAVDLDGIEETETSFFQPHQCQHQGGGEEEVDGEVKKREGEIWRQMGGVGGAAPVERNGNLNQTDECHCRKDEGDGGEIQQTYRYTDRYTGCFPWIGS